MGGWALPACHGCGWGCTRLPSMTHGPVLLQVAQLAGAGSNSSCSLPAGHCLRSWHRCVHSCSRHRLSGTRHSGCRRQHSIRRVTGCLVLAGWAAVEVIELVYLVGLFLQLGSKVCNAGSPSVVAPQTILLCALQHEAELAAQQGLLQQALAERDQARQALAAAQREVGPG